MAFSSLKERDSGMKYFEHLKKNNDFRNVYGKGKSQANKYLVMYFLENGLQYNRLGISVSKKVGNSVVRHRLTRLIRESVRLNEERFELGYDIVIIARANLKGKGYRETESALLHVSGLNNLLKRVDN